MNIDEYTKKAMGPYNSKMKYQGAENIAIRNKYVKKVGNRGIVATNLISKAEEYYNRYYNSADMRTHLFKYINYFCNYYDPDWEYMSVLLKMKMNMDRYDASAYSAEALFYDMNRYIVRSNIAKKVEQMVQSPAVV